MDTTIQAIQAMSGDQKQLSELKTHLTDPQREKTIIKHAAQIDTGISHLNATTHTLGYICLLHGKICAGPYDPQVFVAQMRQLLLGSTAAQLQLVPSKVAALCSAFAEKAIETKQPVAAILPLANAVEQMQSSMEQLTPVHKDLLQVCLSAKCFKAPLKIMERDIFEVSASGQAPCAFRDLLLYYYYGGMVYIGLKQFTKALDFLRLCFTAPTVVLNQIMVEAYKKYMLISLIQHGEVQGVHKYTSQLLIRHAKSCCQAYTALSSAFEQHNPKKLRECIGTHEGEYKKDENFGLVLQVEAGLIRHNIQRLKKTYLTLSLAAIAQNVGCADAKHAEQIVLEMAGRGDLLATINQQDGMVAFHDDEEQYNSSETIARLHEDTQKAIELNKKLQALEASVMSDPTYLGKVALHERHSRWGESDAASEGATNMSLWPEADDAKAILNP